MPRNAFLQVGTTFILAFFLHCVAGAADAALKPTPRQLEIVKVLETTRPAWASGDGVWMLGEWDTDVGLDRIVDLPAGRGNAAEKFRLIEDLYLEEKDALAEGGEDTRGVAALLEAADMAECRLIPDFYPEYDNIEAKQPDFMVLRLYLDALLRRAERALRNGNAVEAERCYRAGLVCGMHLTGDKSSSVVFATGLFFKLNAASAYHGYLARRGDSARAEALKGFIEVIRTILRAYSWKSTVALGEMDHFACLPAVIRIAREDREVFWRKEAVLRLSRLRYGVPLYVENRADGIVLRNPDYEQVADSVLSAVAAQDPEPSVRRLAVWAAGNLGLGEYDKKEHRYFEP